MKTIKNVVELRNALIDNYNEMRDDVIDVKKGKELTNALGKVINLVKLELAQNVHLERKNTIAFLENEENVKYNPE